MKHMKKMMALVIAMVMILGTMSMTAFAADPVGALSVNGNLKIGGLDKGDKVTYYQILKWNATETDSTVQGWTWADGIDKTKVTDDDLAAIVGTNDQTGQISAELAGKLAEAVGSGTETAAISGTEWTQKVTAAGLYMATVEAATAGTLYNPIFVAANWVGTGETADTNNEKTVVANQLDYTPAAMAKKTTITLDKESTATDSGNNLTGTTNNSYTADVDEPINFTVKTHVPKFASNYTSPVFKIADTLNGLALTGDNVKVYKANAGVKTDTELVKGKDYTITGSAEGSTTYTITFTADYLQKKGTAGVTEIPANGQDIVIEYTAKVTDSATKVVNQEKNTVDLIYSTSPTDTQGKGLLRDQTNHFTFSIDADLLGHSEISGSSTEAIKVGVDKEGNYIVESSTYAWSNQKHGPLEGAEFKLYKDSDCTQLYTNTVFNGTVESDGTGRINIKGLDAGTYYLKETKAPTGYIKMQDAVTITITADISEEVSVKDEIGEGGDKVTVTYKTNKLNGYTVSFNNQVTTKYTITNAESSAEAVKADRVTPPSSDFELKNTKGVELPSTGGMGTTIFYIIGAILVLGAGVLLVTRRRMSAK